MKNLYPLAVNICLIALLFLGINMQTNAQTLNQTVSPKTTPESTPILTPKNVDEVPSAIKTKEQEKISKTEEERLLIKYKDTNKITIDDTSSEKPTTPELPKDHDLKGIEYHQIYLDQPVKSLDNVEYKDGSGNLNGKISKDGKRVLIKNYEKRGQVKFNVTYKDGTKGEFFKSSCFIDPVAPL